jgi:4-amino-4-deoxy-L-arabinose transferase-like glycosyltransferase
MNETPSPLLCDGSKNGASFKRWFLLLCSASAFIAFFNLSRCEFLSHHEVFYAMSSREMLQTGDWLIPRYGGLPQLNKPPWGYWLAAVMGLVTGEVNEWSARFPSALSGVCLVFFIGYWAARWYGRAAGLCAAFVQTTSIYYFLYARESTVDMNQTLCIAVALFLAADEPDSEGPLRSCLRWLGFWTLLGITWLQKLIFGPVMVLMPVLLFRVVQGRRLFQPIHVLGLLLASLIAVPWTFFFIGECPEVVELWRHETIGRVAGEMHHIPWWTYLVTLVWVTLPCGPLALGQIPSLVRGAWLGNARARFLLIWPASQILLISLSSNKHANYLLAALPAFSLLGAIGLVKLIVWLQKSTKGARVRPVLLLLGCALGGAATLPVLLRVAPRAQGAVIALVLFLTAGAFVGIYWLIDGKLQRAGSTLLLLYLTSFGGFVGWLLPSMDSKIGAIEFARRAHRQLPHDQELISYAMGKRQMLFYLQGPFRSVEEPLQLKARVDRNKDVYVLTLDYKIPFLAPFGNYEIIDTIDPETLKRYPKTEPFVVVHVTARERAEQAGVRSQE